MMLLANLTVPSWMFIAVAAFALGLVVGACTALWEVRKRMLSDDDIRDTA